MTTTSVPQPEHEPARPEARVRQPLGAVVSGEIRAMIKADGLVVGDPLPSESELAVQFGVSQRVVRDALRILSNQGVLRTRQGKRATVSELRPVAVEDYFRLAVDASEDAIHDLLELRLALETRAAGLAAARASSEDIRRLRELLDAMSSPSEGAADRVEADLAFHSLVVRCSRNRFFEAVIEALSEALVAERQRGSELTEAAGLTDHDETNVMHSDLLSALEARDTLLAEHCMEAILKRAQSYFGHDPAG